MPGPADTGEPGPAADDTMWERFFQRSVDPLAIVGFDGRFERVNPAWTQTLGWDTDELVGSKFIDYVHPDDVDRTEREAQRLAETGEPARFENRYETQSGEYRWLAWRSYVDQDEERYYSVARDVTHRKHAEQERDLLVDTALRIGEAEDLETALTSAIEAVCDHTRWAVGEAWLPTRDATRLVCDDWWYATGRAVRRGGLALAQLRGASLKTRVEPGQGMVGRAWSDDAPVWVDDVSTRDDDRAELAARAGLGAAAAIPMKTRGQTAAVLVFYLFESSERDRHLVDTVSAVGAQIGGLVRRRRLQELETESASKGPPGGDLTDPQLRRAIQQVLADIQALSEGLVGEQLVDRAGKLDTRLSQRDEPEEVPTPDRSRQARETEEDTGHVDASRAFDEALLALKSRIHETGARVSREPLPDVSIDGSRLRDAIQHVLGRMLDAAHAPPTWAQASAEADGGLWQIQIETNTYPDPSEDDAQLDKLLGPRAQATVETREESGVRIRIEVPDASKS